VPQSKDQDGFDRIKARPTAGERADAGGDGGAGAGVSGPAAGGSGDEPGIEEQAAAVVDVDPAAMLDRVTRERDEYLDMSRRVQADFENYKKRMLREQTSILERAGESLVQALLPVLDAFDLAKAHIDVVESSPEGKALMQASALLADALAKEGLERIDAVGVAFDPTVHEAVEHLPAEDTDAADVDEVSPGGAGAEDGPGHETAVAAAGPVVIDVLRAGYRWKGRVIRPPMVRVRG
jgi:molecular chaperone GrpE